MKRVLKAILRWTLRAVIAVVLLLLVAWGATGAYFHFKDRGPWPERVAVAPTGVFANESNCFHGGGYDEWIGDLRGMYGRWNYKSWLLPVRFRRDTFEHANRTVECRWAVYESDGFPISVAMLAPRDTEASRLPVIVWNRGGNGSFGSLKFALLVWFLAPYAEQGFLVVASDYRGARESSPSDAAKYGLDEFGGADVRDLERLLALVATLPQADPDQVFMIGESRGSMMAFMVARRGANIRALASINGAADLERELAFRPEMERVYQGRIPDYATRKQEALAERSVLRWADELPRSLPILLVHAGRDVRVDPANGPLLKARLDELGFTSKLVQYPDDDHDLSRHRSEAEAEVIAWFRQHAQAAQSAVTPVPAPGIEAAAEDNRK
jgi:pimeloyl-ACP methyl ester carboxylesterase